MAIIKTKYTGIQATGTPSSTTFLRGDGTWNAAVAQGPTLSGISPSVITNDATSITISGGNFVTTPFVDIQKSDTGAILQATSVSFTSASTIVANFTQSVDGTYFVRVENPDGNAVRSGSAILTVADAPAWQTASGSLGSFAGNFSGTIATVSATGANAYAEVSGTALTGSGNANCTISSGGVISTTDFGGTGTTGQTYTFTIRATDSNGLTADRQFTLASSYGATGGGQFN